MPFNPTTGVFTRVDNSFSEPVNETVIDPAAATILFDDYDDGLTETVTGGIDFSSLRVIQTDTLDVATNFPVRFERSNLTGVPTYPPGTAGVCMQTLNGVFGDIDHLEYAANISAAQANPISHVGSDIVGLKCGALREPEAIGSVNGIWGLNIDLQDHTERKSSLCPGTMKANEINLRATGQDDAGVRIANDTILWEYVPPISGDTATSFYAANRVIPAGSLSDTLGFVIIENAYLADQVGLNGGINGEITFGFVAQGIKTVAFISQGTTPPVAVVHADHTPADTWYALIVGNPITPSAFIRGDGLITTSNDLEVLGNSECAGEANIGPGGGAGVLRFAFVANETYIQAGTSRSGSSAPINFTGYLGAGTQAMRVDVANGKVRIGGATNPSETLDVTGTGTFSGVVGLGVAPSSAAWVKIAASTTAKSQFNLPTGSAPSSPVDGDVWREDNTNTGLKIRINGVTKTIVVA